MERVWNGHPAQHHFSGTAFDGLERRGSGTEFGDLIRSSGSGSRSGCALALVPHLSY